MRYVLTFVAALGCLALSGLARADDGTKAVKDETFAAPPEGFDTPRDGIDRGRLETVEYDSTTIGVKRISASSSSRMMSSCTGRFSSFAQCAACHATVAGAAPRMGPNLAKVLNRKAGTLPGYAYSPALKKSGITWSRQTLDSYLADPQKVVPANRMPYAGMPEAKDRADLLDYMQAVFK